MKQPERCSACGELTGRDATGKDPLFLAGGNIGPLCESCYRLIGRAGREHRRHTAKLNGRDATIRRVLTRVAELEAERQRLRTRVTDLQRASELGDQIIAQWQQRVAELEAIVSRLPRTADGVPLQIGDKLWTYDAGAVTVQWFVPASGRWVVEVDRGSRFADELYSTQEAARAAGGSL